MGRNKEVLSLLLLAVVNFSYAEVFYNIIKHQENPCVNICKQAVLPITNIEIDPEGKYVTTCCQRGCRFFNLLDLVESNNLNNSLDACYSSCTEAYTVLQDMIACRIGCASMENKRGTVSLASIMHIQIGDGVSPNILLISPDISENDILTDPGLRKEILPEWWDSNGFKLPETYFKTVPIDSGTVDYNVVSEERSPSLPGSDWLQCASRHTGIPRWLLAFAIAAAALSALWLCLSPEKTTDTIEKITPVKLSSPSKIILDLPDEAPLYKKPPPKYHEVVDPNDPNLQV
ncbi:hypothetical protein TSAR_015995 [Trichomalopsis sarcophagae]|uniref:Transmembrane protein 59-like n=1 Tax=Trichomalopsis sarcophagae TaxID=543379 RepID=A0A232F312_9HYME|nr:hypothetical protein TSAR_015995 [Trichomalopsis sarcophagae]